MATTVNTFGLQPAAYAAWLQLVQSGISNPTMPSTTASTATASATTPLLSSQAAVTSAASTALPTSAPVSAPAAQPLVLTAEQEAQARGMTPGITLEVARQMVHALYNPTFVPATATPAPAGAAAPAAPANPAAVKAEKLKNVYSKLSYASGVSLSAPVMCAIVAAGAIPVFGWVFLALGLLLLIASLIVLKVRHDTMQEAGLPTNTMDTLLYTGVRNGAIGAVIGAAGVGISAGAIALTHHHQTLA